MRGFLSCVEAVVSNPSEGVDVCVGFIYLHLQLYVTVPTIRVPLFI